MYCFICVAEIQSGGLSFSAQRFAQFACRSLDAMRESSIDASGHARVGKVQMMLYGKRCWVDALQATAARERLISLRAKQKSWAPNSWCLKMSTVVKEEFGGLDHGGKRKGRLFKCRAISEISPSSSSASSRNAQPVAGKSNTDKHVKLSIRKKPAASPSHACRAEPLPVAPETGFANLSDSEIGSQNDTPNEVAQCQSIQAPIQLVADLKDVLDLRHGTSVPAALYDATGACAFM